MNAVLTSALREKLIIAEGVKKHGPMRRASIIFANESTSDSVFFLEAGYIKLVKKGAEGKEVLIGIISPGQIFGEQAISFSGPRNGVAEVLQDGIVYEVPRQVFVDFCNTNPDLWRQLSEMLLGRQRSYEQKIEMLCLADVETRILHYLEVLPEVFGLTDADGQEYSLPLSQSELASLIGATRETTSTILNALQRKGVVRLGRRMLTVKSADVLRSAMRDTSARAARI
jgi:CRP/FNR family transcriptional regulator, cyclic AMP receptor protein